MNKEDAGDLFAKGIELYKSGNLEEAIKCFTEVVRIQPDADAFNKWGEALYDLAEINKDESLYRESCEKYEKAVQLAPDHSIAFNKWGNALYCLAKIRQDEPLYWESCEKYEKAVQLKPDYASAYNNLGNVLSDLAKIKQDEPLYRRSFEKYEKAVQLASDDTDVFYNWGNALSELAQIKQDEPIFGESFEKYEKAVQLKPDYASAYNNWGNALSELAQIKQDEPLYRESFEKYEKAVQLKPDYASAYNNWGNALCYLAQIKQDESLYREAAEHFKKSKLDILDILVNFDDKKDRKHITQTETLYPLLDLDTDDGRFFKEAAKNIKDKTELNKYKKVYILSILIISQLHVNKENEEFVATYREETISQKMLFEDSKFWLTAINYSNDLKEGKTLFDYLFEKDKRPTDESLNRDYSAFAGCFTYNYDSLNQFRLYGKEDGREGTGLSLVFRDSFFSEEAKMAMKQQKTEDSNTNKEEEKHALFRCIYIDPETRRVETVGHKDDYLFYREKKEGETGKDIKKKIISYRKDIDEIIVNVTEKMEELKELVRDLEPAIVGQLLLNLRYLTKHIGFKEEQECRILKIYHLNDKKIEIKTSDNFKQMYVEYRPKVLNHIEKIIFGPKADGMELFRDILTRNGLSIIYKKSENPLA